MLDLKKFQILMEHPGTVLVEKDAPLEMKLMIMAAVQTYRYGSESIDDTLERFGPKWRKMMESHDD